ncbi:RNA polymerase sigma factor [Pedobacter gandavensis]|uniref:Sigma-70 family RNA polymerase sigma factor n=1 Tax=Pedobacter gandavensis TaxID=2679963 RepID=A0ABR6ESB4_9SPHI|nr:sigma-70 family RNA polymerase sigma factor [Pedobacter gandavensis]MBB2148144.1 sigma-70 family RNA polymerase sigma factor [Pedobacter gandavensis]
MENKKEFVEIIKDNQALIYKVVKVYTDGKAEEQDLYQEIIYQLWKSFASFRNESKLTTWMYRIALNTAIVHLKKEQRKGSQVSIDEQVLNQPDTSDTLKEEQFALLYAQIRKLNSIDKAIVLLYLEGKTHQEISAITGFSTTNVATRLSRIKQKIIAQIK